MAAIGFSTGAMSKEDYPIFLKLERFLSAGATAVELNFSNPDKLAAGLSDTEIKMLKRFQYVSIHAPWDGITYKNDILTSEVLGRIKSLHEDIGLGGIIVHPNVVADWGVFDAELPYLIENLSNKKKTWTHPKHFADVLNGYANLGLILDVEHAYGHDINMGVAMEFVSLFKKRLKELHVSGELPNGEGMLKSHCPVNIAENRSAIDKILDLRLEVPIILEGVVQDIPKGLVGELQYITRF